MCGFVVICLFFFLLWVLVIDWMWELICFLFLCWSMFGGFWRLWGC